MDDPEEDDDNNEEEEDDNFKDIQEDASETVHHFGMSEIQIDNIDPLTDGEGSPQKGAINDIRLDDLDPLDDIPGVQSARSRRFMADSSKIYRPIKHDPSQDLVGHNKLLLRSRADMNDVFVPLKCSASEIQCVLYM